MRLLTRIILAVFLIAALSLGGAAGWVILKTAQLTKAEAKASADRVVREAQALAWKELTWRGSEGRYAKYAFPDWRSSETLRVIAPGHCVALTWAGEATLQTCSGSAGIGMAAPAWFELFYESFVGRPPSISRTIILNRKPAGEVVATPDRQATTARAWQLFSIVLAVAGCVVASISILSAAVIGYALYPTIIIVGALKRLESGDYSCSIPDFRAADLGLIARAVNDLKHRLLRTTAERAELTKRLFVAQEEERISLARDLHDEFGQCLTATAALASTIAATARHDRPEIALDARDINGNVLRMLDSLKGCIARLRPPEMSELGLMGSLSTLVTRWNATSRERTVFRLDVEEDFTGLDDNLAVCIYRIVQECLTNASKHGSPTLIAISLKRLSETSLDGGQIELVVEDDGGGRPQDVDLSAGHGIMGMRERIRTLAGTLSIDAGSAGIRVLARIPFRYDLPRLAA